MNLFSCPFIPPVVVFSQSSAEPAAWAGHTPQENLLSLSLLTALVSSCRSGSSNKSCYNIGLELSTWGYDCFWVMYSPLVGGAVLKAHSAISRGSGILLGCFSPNNAHPHLLWTKCPLLLMHPFSYGKISWYMGAACVMFSTEQ